MQLMRNLCLSVPQSLESGFSLVVVSCDYCQTAKTGKKKLLKLLSIRVAQ